MLHPQKTRIRNDELLTVLTIPGTFSSCVKEKTAQSALTYFSSPFASCVKEKTAQSALTYFSSPFSSCVKEKTAQSALTYFSSPFSPCGRRWRAAPDEGCLC